MRFNNHTLLMGVCASKPELKKASNGKPMAVLTMYTKDRIGKGRYIDQPHRCLFFGDNAKIIVEEAEKGRQIILGCMLSTQRKEESRGVRYYTNIIVEHYEFPPPQSMRAAKNLLREIIEENNITSTDQMGIFKNEGDAEPQIAK